MKTQPTQRGRGLLFNDLLKLEGLDPADVAVALHKPSGVPHRLLLAEMAEHDLALFDAYQSTHPPVPEATLKRRSMLASFVVGQEGEMAFVGMYRHVGHEAFTAELIRADRVFRDMATAFGGPDSDDVAQFAGRLRFQLPLTDHLSSLRRRLIVSDPGARNYMRRADTTVLEVLEVKRRASLVPPMPRWDHLALAAQDVRRLPREWASQLGGWRGIYLIVDEADGARYVGAAYGEENLLGRWRAHVAGPTGVTKELRKRSTEGFRFSVLELLSPAAGIDEVTACERRWMDRLDTIRYGLNT